MAPEKPQFGIHVELGDDFTLVELAAILGNTNDAIEHQHRRQRQQRVAGAEQFSLATIYQFVVVEAVPVGER